MNESLTLLSPGRSQVLQYVVQEHALEAALLFVARRQLANANDVRLEGLARHDERIEAHLDGIRVAGNAAHTVLVQLMLESGLGEMFVVASTALSNGDIEQLRLLLRQSQANPEALIGVCAAMGWNAPDCLRGVVIDMLQSTDGLMRLAAAVACSMHRADPRLPALLSDPDSQVRARALRMAGELGTRGLVSRLAADAMQDADPACRFWGIWSAVLCGDRERALRGLIEYSFCPGPYASRALQLLLQTAPEEVGHALLQERAGDPNFLRTLIAGTGFIGDPNYVPWLLRQMENQQTARIAGQAMSLITGLDLWQPPFFREAPEDFEAGPSEDPADENVEMDDDDGLPWPDQASIQVWWDQQGTRLATGLRHFMGQPLNRSRCIEVLNNGYQRQRIAAAYHLSLMNPGSKLFEWRAPAWRQQRELAQLG